MAFFTSLFFCVFQAAKSQSNQLYTDSIKRYQLFVDSLIQSYYSNPATTLSHAIIHYNCPDGDDSYGSGGSADLYQDPKNKTTYQLSYIKGCDTVKTERVLYFKKNKIVLALISDIAFKPRVNYYKDDKLISTHTLDKAEKELGYKDLVEGYEVLKDFKF
jgi:hypothetical protein